jgi:hypothetical protein
MKLAIYSNKNIIDLEKIVKDNFEAIPNSEVKIREVSPIPFSMSEIGTIAKFKSISFEKKITI